jgi:hypothetical protein
MLGRVSRMVRLLHQRLYVAVPHIVARISQMDRRLRQFCLSRQCFMVTQVAEARRTRRAEGGICGSANVPMAFRPVDPIPLGNPGGGGSPFGTQASTGHMGMVRFTISNPLIKLKIFEHACD